MGTELKVCYEGEENGKKILIKQKESFVTDGRNIFHKMKHLEWKSGKGLTFFCLPGEAL